MKVVKFDSRVNNFYDESNPVGCDGEALDVVHQGPNGPSGASGVSLVAVNAIESLSGHRAVYATTGGVRLSDANDSATCNVLGVTLAAVIAGDQINVQTAGELSDPSFSFLVGPVYLGAAGLLTNTVPISGSQVTIGKAITPTRLVIEIEPPIRLT